jgi:hypothetical protein
MRALQTFPKKSAEQTRALLFRTRSPIAASVAATHLLEAIEVAA